MKIKQKIMYRVRASGRGGKIFAPSDFVDLGSRAAIDQALSRLVLAGELRRVGRGLYDWPRQSQILGAAAPAAADDVVQAVARRAGTATAPDNMAAANALGLTTAVLSRPIYASGRRIRDRDVGRLKLRFRPIGAKLAPLLATDAAVIVQALAWARSSNFDLDHAARIIARNAPDNAKRALAQNMKLLPVWALAPARLILGNREIKGA